jgi:hypothetical protein
MSSDLPKDVFEEVIQILYSIEDSPASEAYAVENIDALETEKNLKSSKCGGCFGGKEVEITFQEC